MDPAAAAGLVAQAVNELGRIDILVNNAGIQHVAPIDEFPPQKWNDIIAINLSSAFHTSRLALPAMRAANWGRIINVASVHGLVASAQKSAYVAAKHGIVGLTKVTALETATTGITCNAICPGWVLTPLVQKQVDAKAQAMGLSNEDAKKQLLLEKEPSLQFTTPEELGELAVFFCSEAGKNVRGRMLDWIEDRYNRRRRHSSIGQISPVTFELQHCTQSAADQRSRITPCPPSGVMARNGYGDLDGSFVDAGPGRVALGPAACHRPSRVAAKTPSPKARPKAFLT